MRELSIQVNEGELVTLIGANGAGKTTTLRAISGVLAPAAGASRFWARTSRAQARSGSCSSASPIVRKGRRVFPYMTVAENMEMGCYLRKDPAGVAADLAQLYERFPVLHERRNQAAGTLSGGEQQMLAISRALMSRPKLVLFDEPSLGLAPNLVERTFDIIKDIRARGVTVVLVEQNAFAALELSDRSYVLEQGRVALSRHRSRSCSITRTSKVRISERETATQLLPS